MLPPVELVELHLVLATIKNATCCQNVAQWNAALRQATNAIFKSICYRLAVQVSYDIHNRKKRTTAFYLQINLTQVQINLTQVQFNLTQIQINLCQIQINLCQIQINLCQIQIISSQIQINSSQIQINSSQSQINISLIFIGKLIRKAEIQCLSNYVLPCNGIMEWHNEHYKFFVINW